MHFTKSIMVCTWQRQVGGFYELNTVKVFQFCFIYIYITTILIFCYNKCLSPTQFCYTEISLFLRTHLKVFHSFKNNDNTYYQYFYMWVRWFSFWYYLFGILVFNLSCKFYPKMAHSTHVTDRKCTQGFDRNIWREETTLLI